MSARQSTLWFECIVLFPKTKCSVMRYSLAGELPCDCKHKSERVVSVVHEGMRRCRLERGCDLHSYASPTGSSCRIVAVSTCASGSTAHGKVEGTKIGVLTRRRMRFKRGEKRTDSGEGLAADCERLVIHSRDLGAER